MSTFLGVMDVTRAILPHFRKSSVKNAKSMVEPDLVRIVQLRNSPIQRTLSVAMRRGEGIAIAQRIRAASIATMREIIAP